MRASATARTPIIWPSTATIMAVLASSSSRLRSSSTRSVEMPSSFISRRLPTKTLFSPTFARTPLPVAAWKSVTGFRATPLSLAPRAMATPSGCSDPASTLPASSRTSVSLKPSAGITSVTSGFPLVIVPVLSNTTMRTSFMVWIASPLRMRTPFSAPMPLPTIRAVGVASPSAQGHAITSTAIMAARASVTAPSVGSTHGSTRLAARRTARNGPGMTSHMVSVKPAMTSTVGTKIPVTLSANSWMGTLVPWASSTSLMTWARKLSLPTLVALTLMRPFWLIVAPITSSPGPFRTGIDSPVAIDSSTGISFSSPFSMILAVLAPSSRSFRMACEALPLAVSSMYRPVKWNDMIMAATPA